MKDQILKTITKLEDLKKQATTERSHYYVANTVDSTIALLYAILHLHYREK